MKDKKHIDRLFQEKFKNFEVSPGEHVWQRINASQKEERKQPYLIPLWYRIAGAASVVLLLSTLAVFWFNTDKPYETLIVNTTEDQNDSTPAIVDISTESKAPETNTIKIDLQDKKDDASKTSSDQKILNTEKLRSKTTEFQKSVALQEKGSKYPITEKNEPTKSTDTNELDIRNSIAKESRVTEVSPATADKPTTSPIDQKANELIHDDSVTKDVITANLTEKPDEEPSTETSNKKSLFDVLKPDEEAKVAEENLREKRWNITPNIAPVYYSSIGKGSSIDPQFKDNNKDGQVNMSYGIQIAYAVNKKIKIRSGINKVDLSYNTEGVGFGPSIVGRELQSVSYNTIADEIEISDYKSPNPASLDVNGDFINKKQNIGFLNQRLNYIEVPLEIEYALVSKRFAVQMIGGLSTLFLSDNEISVQSGGLESSIGTANNLNSVSFSGNIGLGLDYNLSKRFQINIEPIFKYQIDAFSKNDGNFKPYYFGVYTGVNFRF